MTEHRHGEGAPPAGAADEYIVIGADFFKITLQLRAGLGAQLVLRHLRGLHIVHGIVLHGLNFKQIAANGLLDELGHDLGVAFFEVFDAAVPIVLTLTGVINDKIFRHFHFLLMIHSNCFAASFTQRSALRLLG